MPEGRQATQHHHSDVQTAFCVQPIVFSLIQWFRSSSIEKTKTNPKKRKTQPKTTSRFIAQTPTKRHGLPQVLHKRMLREVHWQKSLLQQGLQLMAYIDSNSESYPFGRKKNLETKRRVGNTEAPRLLFSFRFLSSVAGASLMLFPIKFPISHSFTECHLCSMLIHCNSGHHQISSFKWQPLPKRPHLTPLLGLAGASPWKQGKNIASGLGEGYRSVSKRLDFDLQMEGWWCNTSSVWNSSFKGYFWSRQHTDGSKCSIDYFKCKQRAWTLKSYTQNQLRAVDVSVSPLVFITTFLHSKDVKEEWKDWKSVSLAFQLKLSIAAWQCPILEAKSAIRLRHGSNLPLLSVQLTKQQTSCHITEKRA